MIALADQEGAPETTTTPTDFNDPAIAAEEEKLTEVRMTAPGPVYVTHRSSKHAGSKPGYQHRSRGRGNTWRAVSRPVRRLPGWKKAFASGHTPWYR